LQVGIKSRDNAGLTFRNILQVRIKGLWDNSKDLKGIKGGI